jgi:UPF0755 protein
MLAGGFVLFILYFLMSDFSLRKEKEITESREITITIPEGMNVRQIAEVFETNKLFEADTFINLAEKDEGYLFPDTYRFYKDSTPEIIISKMKSNFDKKITSDILNEQTAVKKDLKDIVAMASILEEEVKSTEERKIVAGILWKRLSLNMGLNVDSSLTYILGKTSAELTEQDLKNKSAYNTYVHRGLPPTPISNPGLDAILSALHPTTTKYFYYLTGNDGATHYAMTLEEHALNKRKFLR